MGGNMKDRSSISKKWFIKAPTKSGTVKNTWKMWGPKGLISTHSYFEFGVAILLAPLSVEAANLSPSDIKSLSEDGIIEVFKNTAREIAVLDIYNDYYRRGWTPRSAYVVRKKLYPAIVKTVTLAWYSSLIDAGLVKIKK